MSLCFTFYCSFSCSFLVTTNRLSIDQKSNRSNFCKPRSVSHTCMAARSGWTSVIIALQVLSSTLETAAAPCLQSRLQSAFLIGVVNGLPADTQVTFCDDTSSQTFVHAEETGVQHFVFSGHIPQHLVGKHHGRWQRVRHNQLVSRGPGTLPALLHLWIRALCSRYKSTSTSQALHHP